MLKLRFNNKIILYIIFPIIVMCAISVVMCIFDRNIFEINVFDSSINDEAFYLKQIKSILLYGSPKGYYGYNNSKAQIGGFGAWSPFLLYIYSILGILFKNTDNVVRFTNILMIYMSLATLFYKNKMSVKRMIIFLFPILTFGGIRYIYSGMSEALYYSAIILIVNYYIMDSKRESIFGILIILLCTISRPYFIIFLIAYLFKYKYSYKEIIIMVILTIISILAYFTITKLFQSTYFYNNIKFDRYISIIRDDIFGIFKMAKLYISELLLKTLDILHFIKEGWLIGEEYTIGYTIFYITCLIILFSLILERNRIYLILLIILIVEYSIVVLMYDYKLGFRHIYIVLLFCWYLYLNQHENNYYFLSSFFIINFLFTLMYFNNDLNKWNIKNIHENYILTDKSVFIDNGDMNENTVFIEFNTSNYKNIYRVMYEMPDYYGYNLCESNYISQLNTANKGYLVLSIDSPNNELYKNRKVLFHNSKIIIYKL